MYEEAFLATSLLNVTTLVSELDLMGEWVEFVDECHKVSSITNRRSLYSFKSNLPWPLAKRQLVIQTNAFIDTSLRSLIVIMKTPVGINKWNGVKINRDNKREQVEYDKIAI